MINVDYPIIDGDGHVVEPDKEMAEYLPERFRRIPGNREYSLFPPGFLGLRRRRPAQAGRPGRGHVAELSG